MGRRRFQCHMQQISRPTLASKYPQMQQVSVHDELFLYIIPSAAKGRLSPPCEKRLNGNTYLSENLRKKEV